MSATAAVGPRWQEATVQMPGKKLKTYCVDTRDGSLYWGDARWEVAIKCTAMFITMPLFMVAKALWFVGRIFTVGGIGENLKSIGNVFYYGVQIWALAGYGIFRSYDARAAIASAENAQIGLSYKEDMRYTKVGCFQTLKEAKAFYIGWCFQIRGNVRNANLVIYNK
jgi:hypothetical protein